MKTSTHDMLVPRDDDDDDVVSERIMFIEYDRGWPNGVVTEQHWCRSGRPWFRPGIDSPVGTVARHWEFGWSKRGGEAYRFNSGMGGDPLSVVLYRRAKPDPPSVIWAHADVGLYYVKSAGQPPVPATPRRLLPLGYRRVATPLLLALPDGGRRTRNPFVASTEVYSRPGYCKICDDYFPDDGECEHLEWCDQCESLVYVDTHVCEDDPDGEPVIHDASDPGGSV
ncbi:MAG: hypothetical protein ACYDCI_00315 [Candidatus Limnocylindrales bacterium]